MRKRYLQTGEVGTFTPAYEEFVNKRMHSTAKLLNKLLKIKNESYLCGKDYTVADLLVFFEYTDLLIYEKEYPEF
jgi:glutathione S-transferase